jgi:hypothetical protein
MSEKVRFGLTAVGHSASVESYVKETNERIREGVGGALTGTVRFSPSVRDPSRTFVYADLLITLPRFYLLSLPLAVLVLWLAKWAFTFWLAVPFLIMGLSFFYTPAFSRWAFVQGLKKHGFRGDIVSLNLKDVAEEFFKL